MSNEEAFLAAIKAAPTDDAPRLIYADWLDEQGRENQAAFIRKECSLRLSNAGLRKLEQGINVEWVSAVYPNYRILLMSFPRRRWVDVLDILGRLTAHDFDQASALLDNLPATISPSPLTADSNRCIRRLRRIGATIEFQLVVK